MLTIGEAIKAFNKVHKELTVTKAADFNNKSFLLNAVEDPNKEYFNDPFYLVSKKEGAVYRFHPSEDMETFIDAINNREIDISGIK